MARARAVGLFIIAPALVLASSLLGALGSSGAAFRIVSVVLAAAAAALVVWGVMYVLRVSRQC